MKKEKKTFSPKSAFLYTFLLITLLSYTKESFSQTTTTQNKNQTNTLSLEFKQVPFSDAINSLSIHQNKNIVLTSPVKTPISIRLKNVSFEQALKLVAESVHQKFTFKDNIYKIHPQTQQTEQQKTDLPFKLTLKNNQLSLEAYDQDINAVLREISKLSELNLSFPYHLKGKVNISIKKIPLIPAINSILKQKNYQLKLQDGIYTMQKISPLQAITTVTINNGEINISAHNQSLKSILFELATKTDTNIIALPSVSARVNANLKGKHLLPLLSSLLSGTGYQCFVSNNTFIIGSPFEIKSEHFPFLKTEVIQLQHIETNIIESKLPALFPKENILVIAEQNAIAITGSEKLIKSFKDYIQQVDTPIPQIKVDVLVVEYKDQMSQESGVDIQGQGIPSPFSIFSLSPDGILQNSGRNARSLNMEFNNEQKLDTSLQVYIRSLVEKGKARIWANPSIWTLSGQEASINVVTEDRFRDERYNSNTGRYESSGAPITIDSGIKLKLKARVVNKKEIILEIEPEVSSATGSFSSDSLPQTNTRSAKTIIKAKNNETIKLGGLIQTKQDTAQSKAPVLSAIPLIGDLFKGEKTIEHTSELVFYITPSILDENNSHQEMNNIIQKFHPNPPSKSTLNPQENKEKTPQKKRKIKRKVPTHKINLQKKETSKRKKVRPQKKFQKKSPPLPPPSYRGLGFEEQ